MKAWFATALLLLLIHPCLQADIALPQAQDRRIDTSGPGILQCIQLMNGDDYPEFRFSIWAFDHTQSSPIFGSDLLIPGRYVSIGNQGWSYQVVGNRGEEHFVSDEIPCSVEYADLEVIRYRLHRVTILNIQDGKLSLEVDSNSLMDLKGREVQGTVRGSLSPIGWLGGLALPLFALICGVIAFLRRNPQAD